MVFGFGMYHAGVAVRVHQSVQGYLPPFIQNNFGQEHMWEHSEFGLLSGMVRNIDMAEKRIEVQDSRMGLWKVDISHASFSPGFILVPKRMVKILGEKEEDQLFIASHIFPGGMRMIQEDFPLEFRQRFEICVGCRR